MQCVTAVDGHWLAELGPMFFTVKESTATRFVSPTKSTCIFLYTQTLICIWKCFMTVIISVVPVDEIQS